MRTALTWLGMTALVVMAGHQASHVIRIAAGTPLTPLHGAHSCDLADHPDHGLDCPACEILSLSASAPPARWEARRGPEWGTAIAAAGPGHTSSHAVTSDARAPPV